MKFLYAFVIFMTAGFIAIAQKPKLHAIFFVDTKVKDIGAYCRKDLLFVNEKLKNMASILNYEYHVIIDTADNFNVKNFESLDNQINTSDSDIIVVYISSHGAKHGDNMDPFPEIVFGKDKKSSVGAMHKKLKQLKHKSLLTIVDACNNYRDLLYDISVGFGVIVKGKEISANSCLFHNYRKLFDKPFDCIVAASRPGYYSLTGPLGSIFTNVFFEQLDKMTMTCRLDKNIGMKILIDNVKHSTTIVSGMKCAVYLLKGDAKNNGECSAFTPVEDLQFR
jgi:hypothetical protein